MGLLRESIRPSSDLRNKYNEISTVLKTGDEDLYYDGKWSW
ncbi:MAG: hypothetical protein ACLUPK_07885 [Veillonella sp.]